MARSGAHVQDFDGSAGGAKTPRGGEPDFFSFIIYFCLYQTTDYAENVTPRRLLANMWLKAATMPFLRSKASYSK